MKTTTTYITLDAAGIAQLQQQGCTATDWQQLLFHPRTDLSRIRNVRFIGNNTIGLLEGEVELGQGISVPCGINDSTLHACCTGDFVHIEQVGLLSHYDIADRCVVWRCDRLVTEGETCFGQGTEIAVLSETGGREIVLHDALSAHEAYLQAMYRHDAELTSALRRLATARAEQQRSTQGHIGTGSRIERCGTLRNIWVGEQARIDGATLLENGTVASSAEAPTLIGDLVISRDFIVQNGCEITDGAMLNRCYVGQASIIGHGFSATDCYFACNCQAEHGEGCAIFAGPYTVTHHRSTLLIGGMYSFMNAGSGTNQSNHMYKLGPSHQGIMERGCKTASSSHILWPARIGAFSMVMGKYSVQTDTADFPFSYLLEQGGICRLVPAIALRNVGTVRDIKKWETRDKRKGTHLDRLVFDAFSPYIMEKICAGMRQLDTWKMEMHEAEGITWHRLRVSASSIDRGSALYRLALDRTLGKALLERCQGSPDFDKLSTDVGCATSWCDLAGLIVPKQEVYALMRRIKDGTIGSIAALNEQFAVLQQGYKEAAWAWCRQLLMERYPGTTADNFIKNLYEPAVSRYKEAVRSLNAAIIEDALKEFSNAACVGFGIDGDKNTARMDFTAVRGRAEENSVIRALREEMGD